MAPFVLPLAIAGLSGLAGLFGGRKKTTETTSNADFTQNRTDSNMGWQDSMSEPMYDPFQLSMRNYLLDQFRNRANTSTDMRGYVGQGLAEINRASSLREQGLKAMLSQRGLSRSPMAAGAASQLEGDRYGQTISFMNQVPLLQRQMQMEDLNQFANFFKGLPVGQHNFQNFYNQGTQNMTGTEKRVGTQTDPGNMMAGLFSGLGAGLALWPRNPSTGAYSTGGRKDTGNY